MAGQDVDAEHVGSDGIVATGTYGVALAPTDATGDLGGTWSDLGIVRVEGVTRSTQRSAQTRRGWQKRVKLRTLVTEAAVRFQFVLVQTTKESVVLFHGVPLIAGTVVTDPSRDWPLIAFDLDVIDGETDEVIREYAPRARVVQVGDQVAVAGEGWGWPITVEAEFDEVLGGYTKQFYSALESVSHS